MNKEAFDAGLAALQAQLDAADVALADAKAALDVANSKYRAAKADIACHVTYGKARGWIERVKRAKREEPAVAEAVE